MSDATTALAAAQAAAASATLAADVAESLAGTVAGFPSAAATAAAPHLAEMEALRDETVAISGLTGEDAAVAFLVEDAGSATAGALSATIATRAKVVENDTRALPYARQTSQTVRNLVSFYFDDAPLTDLTQIKTITDPQGIPVTIAAVSDYVDNSPTFMTSAQLLQLQSEGWQIDSHTRTHAHLASLTDAQIEDELRTSRDTLRDMGLSISSITYPFGEYDARVAKIASKYYRAGFSSVQGTNVVPVRTHALRRVHMMDYTLENMKARIDALNGGWIVFYGHSNPANWTQSDIDKFVGLIDYAQSLSIEIVTVDEALDAFENKLEVADDAYLTTGAAITDGSAFVVGADGRVYGSQITDQNHVYLAPTGITNTTPITSFAARKVTTVSFTSASGSGISLGQSGAGTLVTYRVNDEDALNFQTFTPWFAASSGGMAFRYWTGSAWGAWKQHILSDPNASSWTFSTAINAYPATAVHGDFPRGFTVWDINSSGATGFPATAGTVTMYRSLQGVEWSYQIFEGYQTALRRKRWMVDATTWSAWTATA